MDKLSENKWDTIREKLKEQFGKEPDIEGLLFLIGIQELNSSQTSFSKEEKEDLMHIATCTLLMEDGFYAFDYRDEEGWPHYKKKAQTPPMDLDDQESFLKEHIIHYFEKIGFLNVDSSSNQ